MLVHHPNDFAKPERAKWVFGRFFGNSMIFAEDGSRYKNIKSAIQSAFTDRAIQTWYHLFWQKALDMVGAMKQQAHRDTNGDLVIEVHELSRRYTMSGMLQSIFGRTIDTSDQMVTLPPLLETILRPAWDIMLYFMFVAAFPLWTLKLIPGGTEARIDRAGQRLRDTVKELIEIRRNSAGDDQHDMLMQLSKNGRLNDDELVSNLLGLSLPGMETSSGSFSWTAMHLARNPEWQSRLREELRAWATDKSGLVDLETLVNPQAPETLDRLAVLDAVCNESLRMSPPSPVNIRVAARDCIIADQLVPAGTKVILCNYMYNRSEEYWGKTANEWDPNHWLSREPSTSRTGTATSTHAAFMVFSHGPRRCTGIKYAHAILRAFVAVFVLSFQFELEDPNQAIVAGGSLASIPNPGVTLRLRALTKKT
jgi:cytochrome P450